MDVNCYYYLGTISQCGHSCLALVLNVGRVESNTELHICLNHYGKECNKPSSIPLVVSKVSSIKLQF